MPSIFFTSCQCFSSMVASSYEIVNGQPGAQIGLPSDGVLVGNDLTDLRLGSSRSPNMSPPLGDASTHAGIFPIWSCSVQKVHFSTTPLVLVGYSLFSNSGLMATRGSLQLKLQGAVRDTLPCRNRQPMQRCSSCMVMPFGSLNVALVGRNPDAGRIITVIAEHQEGPILRVPAHIFVVLAGNERSYAAFQIHLISFFRSTVPSGS